MNRYMTFLRARAGIVITSAVIVAIAAPLGTGYAGEPGGQGADKRSDQSAPPALYTLQGDGTNNGSAATNFYTTYGDATGAWYFRSYSNAANVVGLAGVALGGTTGTGVVGQGSGRGVFGSSDTGIGVYGSAHSSGGIVSGVYGESSGTNGTGVQGYAGTGSGSTGVVGRSVEGYGVMGVSTSSLTAGVYGWSVVGSGVYGKSTNNVGVYGVSEDGVALFGGSTTGSGFYGFSDEGPGGVMGSNNTEGARFYTRDSFSYALVTGGLPNTYGNVYITGNYQATGTKSARVETSQGPRLMYATEGTQNIFSDQGTGTLVNGRAVITIDPLYAQTVNLKEDYQVFLTPRSADTYGLAVVSQNARSFEVRELHGGTGGFKFNWKIEALRKGYENDRLEDAGPAPASGGKAYEMPAVPHSPEGR